MLVFWHSLAILLLFSVLTFGFHDQPVVYDMHENDRTVNLSIFFMSGNPGEFVPHVNVLTVDGTATGKQCIGL